MNTTLVDLAERTIHGTKKKRTLSDLTQILLDHSPWYLDPAQMDNGSDHWLYDKFKVSFCIIWTH